MRSVPDRKEAGMLTWRERVWRGPLGATWIGVMLVSDGRLDGRTHWAALALVTLVGGVALAALDALTGRFPVIHGLDEGGSLSLAERLWLAALVVAAGLVVLWVGPSDPSGHVGAVVLVALTAAAAAVALPTAFLRQRGDVPS